MRLVTDNQTIWRRERDELASVLVSLGFPAELGSVLAKEIGSPKGMERMTSYLYQVKPQSMELIADEMIAIKSDIERWRDRKKSEDANAAYNMMLNCRIDDME